MNYYRRYVGDYMRDTMHLSMTEHGAYNLLLDATYATEKPLPEHYEALYRVCRAMSRAEQDAVKSVADQFFPIGVDGLRHNPRADREIGMAQSTIDKQRESGVNSAAKRWSTNRSTHNKTNEYTDRSAIQPPTTIHQPPIHQPPTTILQPPTRGSRAYDARASRLPADWTLPGPWCEWSVHDRGWTPEHAREVSHRFKDHWIAKPGKDGKKLDWLATWRNWCRNERVNGSRLRQSVDDKNRQAAEQWLADSERIIE